MTELTFYKIILKTLLGNNRDFGYIIGKEEICVKKIMCMKKAECAILAQL